MELKNQARIAGLIDHQFVTIKSNILTTKIEEISVFLSSRVLCCCDILYIKTNFAKIGDIITINLPYFIDLNQIPSSLLLVSRNTNLWTFKLREKSQFFKFFISPNCMGCWKYFDIICTLNDIKSTPLRIWRGNVWR